MKIAISLTAALLVATFTAHADFSYTTTQKATGGQMAAMAAGSANQNSKFYLKGQKMKTENGDSATILDFDAQTITTLNNKQKTVSVRKFTDVLAGVSGVNAKVDVKETGQKKVVNGYNARELVLTIQMDSPAGADMGKIQMEMDMWMSSDPPGVKEMRAFYQKNMNRFPWAALGGDAAGNPGMQAAMAEMQRKMAEMDGVNVMEVMKMKVAGAGGTPAMPQMSPEEMAQMKAAMARLQAQGGPGAAQAQQAMARMQAMQGGAGASSGSLMEMTMESIDFSTNSVPDSVFAVPAGYRKVDQK